MKLSVENRFKKETGLHTNVCHVCERLFLNTYSLLLGTQMKKKMHTNQNPTLSLRPLALLARNS